MRKKIRNDSIFKKPVVRKTNKSKKFVKIFSEDNTSFPPANSSEVNDT